VSPLPHGVHAYGVQIPAQKSYSVSAPAVDENMIVVQLTNATDVAAMIDRHYHAVMERGSTALITLRAISA
jgi:hypothetical protein